MKRRISPAEIRRKVKEGLRKEGITAAAFYRKFWATLPITVKCRTFEMFVTSSKMKGTACLIGVYEFMYPNKRIKKTGDQYVGFTWYEITLPKVVHEEVCN